MTTAHRPTWYNAIGGDNQGGNRKVTQTTKVCSRDLPGHTEMKLRDLSDYIDDKNTMKENLNNLESNNIKKKILAIQNIKKITNQEYVNPFPEDEDDIIEDDFKSVRKKKRKKKEMKNVNRKKKRQKSADENPNPKVKNKSKWDSMDGSVEQIDVREEEEELEEKEDNSSSVSSSNNDSDNDRNSDSSESSDDETDEEERELMRELENLKREKMERLKKEKEEQERLKHISNNVLTNNPLINLADSDDENAEGKLKKRKWTDDAIFRNTCEKKEKVQTFVNDTVRSAFHKKFLLKYIH